MSRIPYLMAHVKPREAQPYLLRQIERRKFEKSVMSFIGVKLDMESEESPALAKAQGIGEFCGGSCINECTAVFGPALWLACRSCPD